MYVEKAYLIVPEGMTNRVGLLATRQEHDKIEVYSGTKAVQQYGIAVEGSGSWAKGNIKGTITTYDYKAVYETYKIPASESAQYWFVNYRKDTSYTELKKTFESSQTVPLTYNVDFEISGNDWGQSAVYITFAVIRLVVNGQTKDFVVANKASTGANNQDGSPYEGGFRKP